MPQTLRVEGVTAPRVAATCQNKLNSVWTARDSGMSVRFVGRPRTSLGRPIGHSEGEFGATRRRSLR